MRYNQEVYIKAKRELERRRESANALASLHRNQVKEKCPELTLIEEQMKSAVMEATALLGKKEDVEQTLAVLQRQNLQAQRDREELLRLSDFPPNYLEPQYECPLCDDKGYAEGRYCSCHIELLRKYAYEELSKTAPLTKCTFDNFDLNFYPIEKDADTGMRTRDWMKSVLSYCENYAETFSLNSNNVHLCGRTGLGKTHLSLAMANVITQKGYNVIYVSAPTMLRGLEKEHFSRYGEETSEEFYLDCDLLIIDDLGTEFKTSFSESSLYSIINGRLLSGKPVIINSNLSVDEMDERYGERLASRIGSYDLVIFRGSDVRQLKENRGL
ncbi:MAG TPA: ATP-binding protein [Oscillospiraceae bacterium]|nr:ATP-binding protein [Oscillospiraceae bacterium]